MTEDAKLCEEIYAEARKRYVGKVAEARATARYAADPEPCSPRAGIAGVLVVIVILGGIVSQSSRMDGSKAGGKPSSSYEKVVRSVSMKDVGTSADLITKMLGLVRQSCASDSCGFSARTSDSEAHAATRDIYAFGYSPGEDNAQHVGWSTFRHVTRLLDCDLHAAFSWTEHDDAAGRPPTNTVAVYC